MSKTEGIVFCGSKAAKGCGGLGAAALGHHQPLIRIRPEGSRHPSIFHDFELVRFEPPPVAILLNWNLNAPSFVLGPMEHIAALLLIIGCSDDLAQCRELPAPVPVFETVEECESELPVSLGSFTGQHPQIFAQCVTVDPALEEEDAELAWDVKPDGTLVASISVPDIMVASNSQSKGDRYRTQE